MITAEPSLRWERYAAGTEAEHFAWWCSRYLIQTLEPFTGQPLVFEPWQMEFWGEALAVDEQGLQLWQSVALIVGRKNGKTQMLAAYALYRLLNDDGYPEILLAAASDKNAGRLFEACVLFIRANPELERQVHLREYIGEIVRRDGLGKIVRLATEPTAVDGYNPSLVICDELHAWLKPRHRKMWAKLTTAGGSRTMRQVFTITTAGEAGHRKTSILGQLLDGNEAACKEIDDDADSDDGLVAALERELALTISRNQAGSTLIYNYSAPTKDRHNVDSLKLANPASWVTTTYLKRQAANSELTSAEVLQYHGCVWAVGETTWLDPSVFADRYLDRIVDDGTAIATMFDGSYSRDSTVLLGATIEQHPHVFVLAIWEKPPEANDSWRTPRGEAIDAVEETLERFEVWEACFDPPGWHREIEELEQRYGDVIVRFDTNQPSRMGPACDDFLQGVLGPGPADSSDLNPDQLELERGDPELTHDGHEALIRHLSNCVPIKRGGHTVVTKESTDSPRKIDAAVGAIVVYHRAKWLHTNSASDLGAILVDAAPPKPKESNR